MNQPPTDSSGIRPRIDGRRRDDIKEDLSEMVPYYVEEWEADEGDIGTTLLSLFAELAEEVIERLDQVPEKHHTSFYDTLGFGRQPPQPAQLPLTVTVADRIGENVTVPAGTIATAEPPDGVEQVFEIPPDGTFDATPANLKAVFTIDPNDDAIYAHHEAVGGSDGDPTSLFRPGKDLQQHALYLGDEERLSVGDESTLTIEIDTDADPTRLHEALRWEYYGEREVNGETIEKWHPFPGQTDVRVALAKAITEDWEALEEITGVIPGAGVGKISSRIIQYMSTPVGAERTDEGRVGLTLVPDGTLTETSVDGIESKWIRCRVPDDTADEERTTLFGYKFGTGDTSREPLKIGASADGLTPDMLLHNDVPLPTGMEGGSIRPFGDHPRSQDTFYIASTDALTKTDTEVTIEFEYSEDGHGKGDPDLSWEYFDGSGWSRIPGLVDNTNGFTGNQETGFLFAYSPRYLAEYTYPELLEEINYSLATHTFYESDGSGSDENDTSVRFDVPADLSKTVVSGHEGHWIRVRLVGGDYGQLKFDPVGDNQNDVPERYEQTDEFIHPPSFSAIQLKYAQLEPPEYTIKENNLGFEADVAVDGSYQPFETVPVDEQAVFLGFDARLTDGPINLLFDLEDAAYPQDFRPKVRWEYADNVPGVWRRLDVLDSTEGLTERGIVGLVFPEETAATEAFGRNLHWVRARVTGDRFTLSDRTDDNGTGRDRGDVCGRFVDTVPPAGEPRRYPPSVRGLYLNATWAHNRRTIDTEVLGGSDGSVEQVFTASDPPVLEPTVWVNELSVLSEGSRGALREQWPDRTAEETNATGEPVAFWVRWEEQPDLLDSGPEDRHYTVDSIPGAIFFGDGDNGKIPPRGADNVRATYTTGGGAEGNVPAGSVSGLQQSIAFVESVTNPLAGSAGADAEATTAVTDRAARELRDRNRAVAPADFERIAMDASRQLARARCRPGMNPEGEYQPGWVTLLVVPNSGESKPRPSATLRGEVERAVAERAPTTLVSQDRLVVRGPSYVSVSIDVELAASGGSVSELEERARETVRSYLHPLTGGPDEDGWRFGELPCRSDFFELLEGLDHVDHVMDLSLQFETSRSLVTVTEGQLEPDTSPDALVHAGTQEVSATFADSGGRRL